MRQVKSAGKELWIHLWKKTKIRISTVLLLVLLFVLLCVVAGAGWKLYRYYADYSKDRDLYSDLRDEVINRKKKKTKQKKQQKIIWKPTEEYLEEWGVKRYRKKWKRISKRCSYFCWLGWVKGNQWGYYWLGIFYRTAADILSCFAGWWQWILCASNLRPVEWYLKSRLHFYGLPYGRWFLHHHTLLSMVIMFVMVRCCQIWLGLKIKPYTMKNHISGFWLRKVTTVIRFSPFSSAIAQQMFFQRSFDGWGEDFAKWQSELKLRNSMQGDVKLREDGHVIAFFYLRSKQFWSYNSVWNLYRRGFNYRSTWRKLKLKKINLVKKEKLYLTFSWLYCKILFVGIEKENLMLMRCPDSSVGRAEDWKSSCRWFDSSFGHCAGVVQW